MVFPVFLYIGCCVVIPTTVAVLDAVQGVEGVILSDFSFIVCPVDASAYDGAWAIDGVRSGNTGGFIHPLRWRGMRTGECVF